MHRDEIAEVFEMKVFTICLLLCARASCWAPAIVRRSRLPRAAAADDGGTMGGTDWPDGVTNATLLSRRGKLKKDNRDALLFDVVEATLPEGTRLGLFRLEPTAGCGDLIQISETDSCYAIKKVSYVYARAHLSELFISAGSCRRAQARTSRLAHTWQIRAGSWHVSHEAQAGGRQEDEPPGGRGFPRTASARPARRTNVMYCNHQTN